MLSKTSDPLILAIETATRAGSVTLARGREILRSTSGDAAASHSHDLIASIERILVNAGVKLSDVDLFAVAVGPGSFTGLRIGLATTKSLAVCMGKRCAGVSTLAAIAHAAGNAEHTVSLLPAGRSEFFAQLFSVDGRDVQHLDCAAHLTAKAILERYGEARELVWAGDGARLQAEALRAWASTNGISFGELKPNLSSKTKAGWSLAPPADQLAASIAALALNTYDNGTTLGPDELKAVYVRASDAEINERWQREKLLQSAPV
jgi:tRNA threonylcarbamoyladenosine biosynthesis protein TsaB